MQVYTAFGGLLQSFGVNHGEKNSQLEKFDDYLKLNITGEGKTKRLFQMLVRLRKLRLMNGPVLRIMIGKH